LPFLSLLFDLAIAAKHQLCKGDVLAPKLPDEETAGRHLDTSSPGETINKMEVKNRKVLSMASAKKLLE
jgi:hypothetical protein